MRTILQNTIHDYPTVLMFIPSAAIYFALTAGKAEKNLKTTLGSECFDISHQQVSFLRFFLHCSLYL